MSLSRDLLMRMFGRPRGLLGRLGGRIMARTNENCGAWAIDLLEIRPDDRVLEVGFGPGVLLGRLSALTMHVAGVDRSREMIAQARARNANAIERGGVALHRAPAHSLPLKAHTFEKALAVNSMPVWPDPVAGLREMHRVMKLAARSRWPSLGIPVSATRACRSSLPLRASSTPASSKRIRTSAPLQRNGVSAWLEGVAHVR